MNNNLWVMVGAPAVASEIPEGTSLFVLDADPDQLSLLQTEIRHRPDRAVLHWQQAVVTAEAQPILWHRFNDRRLDGPWEESHRRRSFPNARCHSSETIPTFRLDGLCDEWEAQGAISADASLSLLLRQGDPLTILRSCGRWLRRVECVHWLDPSGEDLDEGAGLDRWILERGFVRLSDSVAVWRRDASRTLAIDLADALREQAALEERLSESSVRLLLARERENQQIEQEGRQLAQLADLSHRCEVLHDDCERLRMEATSLHGQLDELNIRSHEQDEQISALAGERDQLRSTLLEVQNDHHELEVQFQSLQERHVTIQAHDSGLEAYITGLNEIMTAQEEKIGALTIERDQALARLAEEETQPPNAFHSDNPSPSTLEREEIVRLQADTAQQAQQIERLETVNQLLTQERDTLFLELARSANPQGTGKKRKGDGNEYATPMLQIFLNSTSKSADKWESYFPIYDRLLAPYRNSKARLLEIGVQNGGSLECWADMLGPASTVVGVDIDPNCGLISYQSENIHCYVGDATQQEWARRIVEMHGPFDIIIDDGSHRSEDIISSFKIFYPMQTRGGLYIVEDLHCSYAHSFGGCLPRQGLSAMNFFQSLTDVLNYEHWSDRGKVPISQANSGLANLESHGLSLASLLRMHSLEFYNSMVVIHQQHAGINSLGARILRGGEALVNERVTSMLGTRLALE